MNKHQHKISQEPIEDVADPDGAYDIVISSLAFHYVSSFEEICDLANRLLKKDGRFVFSAEHPIFTVQGTEDWWRDESGRMLHWPVDRYFSEGVRRDGKDHSGNGRRAAQTDDAHRLGQKKVMENRKLPSAADGKGKLLKA